MRTRSDTVLGRLTRLHPKLIDLSLDRVERLLGALGHPEHRLPPVVHVAGTNGKGSSVAFMTSICEAAGLRVHAYTSPHLVSFRERIYLAGAAIEEERLADILTECEKANRDLPITFFEITTAAAFLAFAETDADIVLLETGLGGRFDATNVIARPAVTAITPVSMDHMHFLGNTIEAIAFEKAGVLKPGVACFVGPQWPESLSVIEARANEIDADLMVWRRDWRSEGGDGAMRYADSDGHLTLPQPALLGRHQIENAGIAIAALRHLNLPAIDETAIANGVQSVRWPARLQLLNRGPISGLAREGWEIWLDGGHNRAAGEALAEVAGAWDDAPLHLVFGMLSNRDPAEFLAPLADRIGMVRTVTIPNTENAQTAEEAAAAARVVVTDAQPCADMATAIRSIISGGGETGRILICGSLYLAGAVLAENS